MSKQKALVYRPTIGKVLEIQVDQHPRYRAQRYGTIHITYRTALVHGYLGSLLQTLQKFDPFRSQTTLIVRVSVGLGLGLLGAYICVYLNYQPKIF